MPGQDYKKEHWKPAGSYEGAESERRARGQQFGQLGPFGLAGGKRSKGKSTGGRLGGTGGPDGLIDVVKLTRTERASGPPMVSRRLVVRGVGIFISQELSNRNKDVRSLNCHLTASAIPVWLGGLMEPSDH